MKRFGLIGDVHAEDQRLKTALDSFAGCDAILCVGDLCDGEGDLDRCIALLEEHEVLTVTGNHDRWLIGGAMRELEHAHFADKLQPRTVEYIARLPRTRRVETDAGPLHLCHGLGKSDMRFIQGLDDLVFELDASGWTRRESLERLEIDGDTRFIVGGHAHRRWAATSGALTMVNPGTLKRTDDPGFGILELGEAWTVRFFELSNPSEAKPAPTVD